MCVLFDVTAGNLRIFKNEIPRRKSAIILSAAPRRDSISWWIWPETRHVITGFREDNWLQRHWYHREMSPDMKWSAHFKSRLNANLSYYALLYHITLYVRLSVKHVLGTHCFYCLYIGLLLSKADRIYEYIQEGWETFLSCFPFWLFFLMRFYFQVIRTHLPFKSMRQSVDIQF